MKESWEKLTAVFKEIFELYQEVLGLGYRKRDVLVQNNVEELMKITRQEEMLLLRLSKLEVIRQSGLQELSQLYRVEDKNVTLHQLSEMADREITYNVRNIEQELRKVILELSQLNEVNKQLVDQGLFIANYSLNLLAQSTVGPTYHPNERVPSASHNKAVFDSKA